METDIDGELSKYITTGGGGIRPFPGPIRPMLAGGAAPAKEVQAAPAPSPSRKKRSIWWPGGGGGWQDISVSFLIREIIMSYSCQQ